MHSPAISDTWERGSPYEQYIGRWSRKVAPAFLAWLDAPPGKSWLDVGCGTGALSAAIIDRCSPASVVGVEPSEGFRKLAARHLPAGTTLLAGNAAAIPLPDQEIEIVVSGLVLNFVPDVAAALAEMRRVAKPGGRVAAYVWDYRDKMALIRHFWDAAVALDPAAGQLDEGARFPICDPEALRSACTMAGLSEVDVTALDVAAEFDDFDDYWHPFLGGQGPAPAYAMSLTEERRSDLQAALRSRLPAKPDGTITLGARAWAVRALTPGAAR